MSSLPAPELDFIVPESGAGSRLDRFLKGRSPDFSRNRIQGWIRTGAVTLNGKRAAPSDRLREGDRVAGSVPPEETRLIPHDLDLDILHEDRHILAVNKPAGLITHPARGRALGTLANALAHHLSGLPGDPWRPGIVHRLDKDTSGVLIVAKTPQSLERLGRQFEKREVKKTYRALVSGNPGSDRGEIEGPIGRASGSLRMGITPAGRYARTDFKVLKRFSGRSYLEVTPLTGRTHQIRVHLAGIGHPVLGDPLYSKDPGAAPRLMLHAWRIRFRHPATDRPVQFTAPLPKDFLATLKNLSA